MAGPTLITSYLVTDASTDTVSLVSPSFSPASGEVIIIKAGTELSNLIFGTPSGGGLTWQQNVSETVASSRGGIVIWSTTVGVAPGSMTVTMPVSGVAEPHTMTVERWSGAKLAATPATGTANAASAPPQCSITTVGANSVISIVAADFFGTPGAETWLGSATPETEAGVPGSWLVHWAYQAAATAQPYTVGLSAPGSEYYQIGAIEIQAANASTESGAFNIALPAPQTSLTGQVLETGAFNVLLPGASLSLTGVVVHHGTFNPVLPAPRTTLSANVLPSGEAGTFSITLPKPVPSLSGLITHRGAFNLALPSPKTNLTATLVLPHAGPFNLVVPALRVFSGYTPPPLTQYATVQNAPGGIGTLTPILIDPSTVTWASNVRPAPDWAPCWIVWNTGHNEFSGIGWYDIMPMYVVPAAVELGGLNSPFPAQPTLL